MTTLKMADKVFFNLGIILEVDVSSSNTTNDQALGFVKIQDLNIYASLLRLVLEQQLPTIPPLYCFLTRDRWPVLRSQETELLAHDLLSTSNTIRIQKKFDVSRVGLRLTSGKAIGFIFIEKNSSVINLRSCIKSQLLEACPELSENYRFLDVNNWPLATKQENQLSVFDVLKNSEVTVELLISRKRKVPGIDGNYPTIARPNSLNLLSDEIDSTAIRPSSSAGFHESGSSDVTLETTSSTPIFISYVRAEAADHALELKRVLSDHGLGVFLDVHEIKAGVDWQDLLNEAILNCQIFVALVTGRYGRTKWSNREVKVADINDKVILPISFLSEWPPDVLAIQFASTHYIPWKTDEDILREVANGEEERAHNINFWDKQHINKVVDIVIEKYREVTSKLAVQCPLEKKQTLIKDISNNNVVTPCLPEPKSERPLIVISVHPKQRTMALDLRTVLGKDKYEVWCSTDTEDLSGHSTLESAMPSPITPTQSLPPGLEHFNSSSGENGCLKKESFNNNNNLNTTIENIPPLLFRRNSKISWSPSFEGNFSLSQMSDCSQTSSLSPEKTNRLEIFRRRIKQASVVLLMVSNDYMASKMSRKQMYYCQFRKKVIVIQCAKINLFPWMKNLLDNIPFVEYDNKAMLKQQIKKILNPNIPLLSVDMAEEERMALMVKRMVAAMGEPLHNCVYIAGSAKFYNQKSEAICHAIGVELANIDVIALVTGGFYGVGDTVGRNFCEERQILRQNERIFHILPEKDSLDYSSKAKQDDEGKFLPVPYGKSFFIGDSVKERECLVARLFSICILIEGGPGAAHEAQQFIWNDNIVIPVAVTGGAAGGKFDIPSKAFICPPGVSPKYWELLSNNDVTPDNIAIAVKRIICSLYKSKGFCLPLCPKGVPLSRQNTIVLNS